MSISDKYLNLICDNLHSPLCHLGRGLHLFSQKQWESSSRHFQMLFPSKKSDPSTPEFVRIWGMLWAERTKDFALSLSLTNNLLTNRIHKPEDPLWSFLQAHKIAALVGLKRWQEAQSLFEENHAILKSQDREDRAEWQSLQAWFCLQNYHRDGCQENTLSVCKKTQFSQKTSELFTLAKVRYHGCLDPTKVSPQLAPAHEKPFQDFLEALTLWRKNQRNEALKQLQSLHKTLPQNHLLHFEVSHQLLKWASSSTQLTAHLSIMGFLADKTVGNGKCLANSS